jgi:hypothetical protein
MVIGNLCLWVLVVEERGKGRGLLLVPGAEWKVPVIL